MPDIIIIRGPLGIGKSTISKKLAEDLDAEYFSVDEILAKNELDVIDFEIGCIPEHNFLKINELIYPDILKNLNKKKSVVIDGNFYHKTVLEDLLTKFNKHKVFVFTLKAKKDVCIKRDAERKKSYGIIATTAVHDLVSKFDYGTLILNEDDAVEEKIKLIKSELARLNTKDA
ncbi:AAA family ATPase [Candidatus Woesearchaeota archaeon]|nr:AAA family ATPase [Candidatus Woesearchaeota archaeon]